MEYLINKIHNNDCFDVLAQIPDNSVDLVLTDPPYMTTDMNYDVAAIKNLDLNQWFAEIIRVAKPTSPILIFSSGKFTYKMVNIGYDYFRYEIIWDKVNKTTGQLNANNRPMLNHEFILYFSKKFVRYKNALNVKPNVYNHGVIHDKNIITGGKSYELYNFKAIQYKKLNDKTYPKSILRYNPTNYKRIHPSEKPFGLIEELINLYSNQDDIVLDTFSGSGIVPYVCILNDRKFIAIEIDDRYYQESLKRIKQDIFANAFIN